MTVLRLIHTTNRNIVGANKTRSIKDGLTPEQRIPATFKALPDTLIYGPEPLRGAQSLGQADNRFTTMSR